jgi:hypothetical protein
MQEKNANLCVWFADISHCSNTSSLPRYRSSRVGAKAEAQIWAARFARLVLKEHSPAA